MNHPGGLGRIHRPDQRDGAHLMATHLTTGPLPARSTPWQLGPVLNQGPTSMCTAFAWRGWKNAEPIMDSPGQSPSNLRFYRQEQTIDGIAGPHEGSTVRAGAQLLLTARRIGEYVWARSAEELAQWLASKSPAVLGVNWYTDMDHPLNGLMRVGGGIRGGHAFLCYWFDAVTGLFWCQNSWGQHWGKDGLFALSQPDVARLLAEQGEACAAVEVRPA